MLAPIVLSATPRRHPGQPYRLRAAQSLGASRRQLLWRVVLPTALPDILTGLRIGLGAGWSTPWRPSWWRPPVLGPGFMVQSAAQFLVTDMVLAGIVVIGGIAFVLELGLRALQQRLCPWHGQQD
ncbi:MAG: ABC transporter permease subunit [Rivihabitans pingtungensis]